MIVYRLDKKAGELSTPIRFTEPADIEGTGLLTQDRADSDSNQWIYLPALERVRRIDSNRRGGRFVNSDYYYEDLRDRQVGKNHINGIENFWNQAKLILVLTRSSGLVRKCADPIQNLIVPNGCSPV